MSLALLPQPLIRRLGSFFDASELVLDIQFGEGGDDSKIFVHQLLAAYLKYAQNLGFACELLHSSDGQAKIQISGEGAGRAFQHEPGKHVVQRIPPTESKGRKQTSTVCVAVLPLYKEVSVELDEKDLRVEPVNFGGKGGQHCNRTLSGCRMTHMPTGLQVSINGRDYHANHREAYRILEAKVNEAKRSSVLEIRKADRKEQMGGGTRSDKIRTYNFMEGRVVDHRLGTKTGNVKGVMKGRFDLLFKA